MAEERTQVDLSSLVGERLLSGVDLGSDDVPHPYYDNETHHVEVMRFVLDGVTYEAAEDPSDGYRSSMACWIVTQKAVRNTFAPVRVVGRWRTKGEYGGKDEVLELIDQANGKTILMIGTENVDDYYPSFCAHWLPGDMAANSVHAAGTPGSES